jgi:hypothetical protein
MGSVIRLESALAVIVVVRNIGVVVVYPTRIIVVPAVVGKSICPRAAHAIIAPAREVASCLADTKRQSPVASTDPD